MQAIKVVKFGGSSLADAEHFTKAVEIVKAISFEAKILVLDEPTSSISDKEINFLFNTMRNLTKQGVGIIYISHKMSELAEVCDRVYMMYAGRILEQADTRVIFDRPAHPYTQGLFRSVKSLRDGSSTLETIPGVVPNLLHLPAGCSFSLRCASCTGRCETEGPELLETEPGHRVRCFLAEKEAAK